MSVNHGEPTASRRGFLAGSAAAAVSASALRPSAYAAENHTLKLGLVGCGRRASVITRHALQAAKPVKLWALGDAFEDRLESTVEDRSEDAETFDVPPERRFVGLDAYRKVIDSGVDAVILAEPSAFKPKHIAYAIEKNVHVFVEKPLAVDAPGVRSVLASAEEADRKGVKVGVGLQRRHDTPYRETIRRLHEGAIGDITYLRVYFNSHDVIASKRRPRQDDWSEMTFQIRNWYYFDWLSGDHYVEQHIHNLDIANWALGAHPVAAHGVGGRQTRISPLSGNIFDHHAVEFLYDDEVRVMSQARQIPGARRHVGEEAHGTNGRANIAGAQIYGPNAWRFDGDARNPSLVQFEALFNAIRRNETHNELEHGAMASMTAILGRMATYSGQMIRWSDAIASDKQLFQDPTSFDQEPRQFPDENGIYETAKPGKTEVL